MNILMTGGTGFIGSRLIQKLVQNEHHIYVLTRTPRKYKNTEYVTYVSFNYPMKRLPFIHAIINLAGESIFGYWSNKKKEAILRSRLETTEKLLKMVVQMGEKPDVFINGSAIGFYGTSDTEIFTENTTKPGDDFLANVIVQWEDYAKLTKDLGIRTVYARFGLVLDDNQGSLPLMSIPIRLGFGGKIGDGEQWMSWIHIEDCLNLLTFALTNNDISGPLNITAPHPTMNETFIKTASRILKRPSFITTPRLLMRTILGEMSHLITKGQYVLPQKALNHGFKFKYPHLDEALRHLYH